MKLRHQQFADAFLTIANGNATKAALAIGCSEASAGTLGARMLKRPDVQAYLQRKAEKADLTSQKALERILRIAETQPAKVNADHVLKANELILKVNGTLNDRHREPRVTVNIGFLQQPAAVSVTTEPIEVEAQVMPSQPQVSAPGDVGRRDSER